MSFQGYVDHSLIGSGKVSQAAIFSAGGDSVWAASRFFSAKPEELQEIIAGFKNPESLLIPGIHVSGVKYIVYKANDRSIYGKGDEDGVIIVKTKQTIIIALHDEESQAGDCAKLTEALADYLISNDY